MSTNYSAKPTDVKNFTTSAEVNLPQDFQDYSEFLPHINRTESLQRFFGATVNQLLSSGSTQTIDAFWGRLSGRDYNPDRDIFNPETSADRLNYQFQPGTVSKLAGEPQQTVSYVNWLKRLESLGADLDNHDRVFSEPGYVLDLPINTDMFVNYDNYYWLEGDIPLIEIEATVTDPIDIDDIVAVSEYTTPTLGNYKTVEFVTGLRVKFIGDYVSSTSGDYSADAIYFVENVGDRDGIKLVEIQDAAGNDRFPRYTPYYIQPREGWDTVDWDTTPWDGFADFEEYNISTTETREDLALNKSYIVMERWAEDKNPWARTNRWFSIHALRVATEYNELDLEAYLNNKTRAKRPIVEFQANMELYNTCSTFVETIDYVISIEQLTEMLSGRANFFIDSENAIQNGDTILVAKDEPGGIELVEFNEDFNDDFDAGESSDGPFGTSFSKAFNIGIQNIFYEDSFTITGVGSSISITPYNSYNNDEYIIVKKGTEKGKIYCYDNGTWSEAQTKETRGSHPLFNLYDQEKTALESFDNTDFQGDKVFGYKTSSAGIYDRELGMSPEYTNDGVFGNFRFEWTLTNNRYNQDITINTAEEIRGFYFWRDRVRDEYFNGWSNIRGSQRVPLIQTQVSDGDNQIEFELGTTEIDHTTEYTVSLVDGAYRWYDHSYIDRTPIGYANPEFVWKYDTEYTINDLISVPADKLEFVDPYGNTDANITVATVSDVLKKVEISSSYDYGVVLYRMQSDPTVYGEIHLTNENHERVRVYKNGQILSIDDDYTISGTTLSVTADCQEDDVVELMYVADTDLENVVYDVAPVHFYNNENNPFTEAGYDDLINHLSRQLSAMPGFEGDIFGLNNYHKTLRLNTYDGLIRQQIHRTKLLHYLLDQENINPIRALKTNAKDYANFKKYFRNKIHQLWKTESWNSVRELVDRAISDINIGKNNDFKYAHSDMLYASQYKTLTYEITDATTTFALPEVINNYGDTQNHIQAWIRDYDYDLEKYIERPLVKGIDYTISGPNLVLSTDNDIVTNSGSIVVSSGETVVTDSYYTGSETYPTTLTIRWYDYNKNSHVPFSAVKLGFFRPTQVEVVDGELIGHDGSRYELTGSDLVDMESSNFDVIAAALWDFELRIYNNLVDKHFVGNDMGQDMMDFYPNPVSEFAYTVDDINIRLDDWYNRWAIENGISEIDNIPYSAGDEFTWNYSTVGPELGSWRSLYVYNFGTDRPDTHPWEMLGHRVKPTWWDDTYSWDAGSKRDALLEALKYGITGNKTSASYVDIRYARSNYDWDNDVLVTDDGTATLNGPVTANVVSSPASVDAAKDFVFGDWSEVENQWRKTSEYLFALAEVYLQLKPYRVHELFWRLDQWNVNQSVTQEQWVDPDSCQRTHYIEMHNQLIEDGVLAKIKVLDGGFNYSSLTFDFTPDKLCYRNADAEAYTDSGNVTGVAVLDPGRGFEKDPDVELIGSSGSSGVELEYTIDQEFVITRLGYISLPSEEFRVNERYTNDLTATLSNLDISYMLHVGGYTDKRILDVQIDGDSDSGLINIPQNSYNILIDRNAPNQTLFYSGVKIEKVEGEGYRVEGYNLDSKYFNYLRPSTAGKQTSVQIGNTMVTKYLKWHNEIARIPYRTTFIKRQELYQFLLGLAEYYETQGFAVRSQWEAEARDAIEWALSNDTDPFYVNGIGSELVFKQGSTGVVQTIDVNYDGVNNVLDHNYKGIRRNDLLVLRDENQTEISLRNGDDRIYGLGVRVVEFEHIIVIDNVTVFNDPIYQPELGLGQNRVRLVGERTRNWNGRVEAPGYIVQDRGLVLNIESSVRELETDWVTSESKALERLTRQTIGFNVGYSKPTYMTNTFVGDLSAYRFEKGERKYRGTESAIEAMTRSKNVFGAEFEHELYEEWMVRLGDYGDVSERNPLKFAVDPDKIKNDPQHFRFNEIFRSDRSDDLIIDINKGGNDAISGDFNSPFSIYNVLRQDNTSIQDLEEYQEFTRDAGLPLVSEIDYFLGSIDDIGDIYDPTQPYALIPNWSETTAYVQGDEVRRYGKVYRLKIESTGLTNVRDDIVVRGTQVFPQIANGETFIANNETVTFSKTEQNVTFDNIVLDGTVTNPTVPSGSTLVLDGINVNFIKTETTTNYSDILIEGNVINPTIENGASRTVTINYANNATNPLTTVTVDFDELDTELTMQQIWINALDTAGVGDPVSFTNDRISALAALQTAYIGANNVSAWESFINDYFDSTANPDLYINPEFLGSQVQANPGAAWETQARNLIDLDLALIEELSGNTSTEDQSSIVSGTLNDSAQFNSDRDEANNLLDYNNTANDDNQNLQSFRTFVETNGGTTIASGVEVTVINPKEYVIDDLSAIVTKINNALTAASAPSDISAEATGSDTLLLKRENNEEGYRLGVEVDTDLGFVGADKDVETQGSTVTGPVDLTLTEAAVAINNASVSGVSAQVNTNVLRLVSVNQTLTVGSGSANDDLGFTIGTYNASSNTTTIPVDLSVGDVVSQINAANIENLTASQVEGVLLITYIGETLEIGAGTANAELGLAQDTYESLTNEVQNVFNSDDWTVVQEPAHFNIWTIDNIGSDPFGSAVTTNRYDVYQTVDFDIGILEVCAGNESGDNALVKTDTPHTLNVGDYFLIVNSTCVPSADGIHQVTGLLNDQGFYYDQYIDEKGFTGKVIPLRSVRFASNVEAEQALENSDYIQSTKGLRNGDYVYVDDIIQNGTSQGKGAVYTVDRTFSGNGLKLVREEVGKTKNNEIKNGVLYSGETGETLIRFEVFDPLKGIIPGIADREIDLRSDVDFANYNNSTDPDTDLKEENAWGDKQVGTVWWDLSNAIYLNYDQSTPEYRQEHWGQLFPTGSIDIYEWTKSPVTPDQYTGAVQAGTTIDGIELTGIPYGIRDQFGEIQYNWCEEVELNPNTNQVETYYYFWVGNKTTTPTLDREYSVLQLEDIILNPTSQQVDWLAATSENTLLASSLRNAIGYDDLVMLVNFDRNSSDYHQEFILLAENDPSTQIPEWLHISLRDSLAGFTQAKGTYEYEQWDSSETYVPDEIVKGSSGNYFRCHTESTNNDPDLDTDNDYWTQLEFNELNPDGDFNGVNTVAVNEPQMIPDLSLHPIVRYGLETRPHQAWFQDVSEARRVLVDKLNDQLADINLIDSDIPWREEFERSFSIGDLEYDIRDYWNFIDWSASDYIFDTSTGDYFFETVSQLGNVTPSEGEIAHIETSSNPDGRSRKQVFKYTNGEWVLVFKEKATIKFNTLLWDNDANNAGWDVAGWDTTPWDLTPASVVVEIFESFYNKIWIEERNILYTDVWFHLAKHVMHEQEEVDWIFKTSYFKMIAEDELEKRYNKYFSDNVEDFFDFINTVKPFRSKLRESIVRKTTDEEITMNMQDTLEVRVQTNELLTESDNTDEQEGKRIVDPFTRSFRLTVGKDGNNYSSQIVDDHKVLLGLSIGPDDTVIPYLNVGDTTLPNNSGAIWINGERIEYTSKTLITSSGIGSGFSSGFSSGFGGVTLLTGITRGTQGTLARAHSYGDIIEDETGFELVENNTLSDYGNDILAAWNESGDHLLSDTNSNANAVTIRGTTLAITGITQADPAVVTVADTSSLSTGMTVGIKDVVGMTEVNDRAFTITVIDGTTFSLDDVDSSGYTAYTSGGVVDNGDLFGTIEPYGSILYTQWLTLSETNEAISEFQDELQELIETYYTTI